MSVKKAYRDLLEFLQNNQDRVVSEILDTVIGMCSTKSVGVAATSVARDESGEVAYIRCGYFEQWFHISLMEFGAKASSSTGYSSMSKEGASAWTRQQRVAQKAKDALLVEIATGNVSGEEAATHLQRIEEERISKGKHPLGADTLEEAVEIYFKRIEEEQKEINSNLIVDEDTESRSLFD
jgi:hypothetical protein